MEKANKSEGPFTEVDPIVALGSIHTVKDSLEQELSKITDTSKKIRFLNSRGMTTAQIYNYLKGKVTTKTGTEIRYQHVRNVLMTKLTGG